ncbi:3'-5' exonuclease [Rhizobium rhizogenes]|uniref:3'-5' exonuclease n=1 Tax=Rhizobium rhizogenes TaxID=359 RepID=UPI00191F3D5A|nr:3'-5' exonuclease [Rhizobium rhizogenes]
MNNLEEMAGVLERSGRYRVLRRLVVEENLAADDGSPTKLGVFIDIESTGLDYKNCEIIEIALLPFNYTLDGRIFSLEPIVHYLNEPSTLLPTEITAITGLTDDMLRGHKLDLGEIEACASRASLVIAHNAAFDRPFAERLSPIFASKPWACTMSDVPWKEEGFEGRRLSDLLSAFSYFFDAHRADDDCAAGVGLLTMVLPKSGCTVFERLLGTARQSSTRIFALNAPFDSKDILKKRGYRWNVEASFGPRAWWREVADNNLQAELNYLRSEIYLAPVELPVVHITALQRYSARIG